ncbi:hypothetical protein [Halobacillus amylolyticus]|uniref:Thioredoxin n=1 Tax=Halobacillus amylolyticus TaxID=2932259 RepID=A0ABY4H883_9BACI|nr:hypothetical protein [Halobacillus amylolyticus]UOR10907.1 hypothetical protein MUO15_15010 [Halobacillus amylolyticus]
MPINVHLITSETVLKNYGIKDFPSVISIEGELVKKVYFQTNVDEVIELMKEEQFKAV